MLNEEREHGGKLRRPRGLGDGLAVGLRDGGEARMVAWFLSRVIEWKVVSPARLRSVWGAGVQAGRVTLSGAVTVVGWTYREGWEGWGEGRGKSTPTVQLFKKIWPLRHRGEQVRD